MAISKNIQNVRFLRNNGLFESREAAISGLTGQTLTDVQDGTIILARYSSSGTVKTLAGLVYATKDSSSITIIDVEGAGDDVEALRQEINAKLGDGVSSANTVSNQLAALSGGTFTPETSSSANTSVEGAKAYAYDLIGTLDYEDTAVEGQYVSQVTQADGKIAVTRVALPSVDAISESGKAITAVSESNGEISATAGTINAQYVNVTGNTFTATTVQGALEEIDAEYKTAIEGLDYTGVTTGTGVYVTNVTEENGVVSATTAELPSVSGQAESKKVVISVSENKGKVSDTKGTISSSAETIVLTDNTDGGVNFEVNIDNNTIIQDAETKKLKVADAALVQYEGDTKTIAISPVQDGVRTVSSIITLASVTPSSTTVREEYALKNASGETIGSTIKIYKDSSLVSITYITNPADDHYQNLEYVYIDASGNTQTEYVNMSSLVLEAEFASGVTFSDGVAHGVVDSTSESFLTVGANGFKLAGVQDAIDAAVADLDATVSNSGNSGHVGVEIVETDGKLVSVTVSEDDIANANDLAELSGKTITAVTSTNGSIAATISNEAGNKTADIQTDADKIKMSGFSADSASALSGIAESDSIATAFEKTNTVITENERVTAAALTDLNNKIASGVASATTEVVEGADEGNNMSISSSAASDGHTVYTISLSDVASATALTSEIAARKAVDGQNGDTYAANTQSTYISDATSLNDADVKLDAALKALGGDVIKGVKVNGSGLTETNNEVDILISSVAASGTTESPIVVNTGNDGAVTLEFQDLDCGTYAV